MKISDVIMELLKLQSNVGNVDLIEIRIKNDYEGKGTYLAEFSYYPDSKEVAKNPN